ncbi:MAG: adenylate/guanylate cyclase domain-containing protein [Gammaproteobacteria bacterium]|nr:adenylate/guanylate cyclase domain-containing protein [Gammaproteobacteria bacterium]
MSASASRTITEISDWLSAHVRMLDDAGERCEAIVGRLREAGLPIARFVVAVRSLHPQADAFSAVWEEGGDIQFREHLLANVDARERRLSPLFHATEEGRSSRHRLDGPPQADEGGIIQDLRDAGMTDYVVIALPFSDGSHRAMTFATRDPRGFGDRHVAILYGLTQALATTLEIRYLRHLAGTLMDTYVGTVAGRKVLDGAIKRGSGETIRAVIWFCDLRGFTALSERLSGAQLLETLNTCFDVMTLAIEAEDGEVLKFIGDAILAIFQPGGDDGDREAAARALAAAQAAVRNLSAVNHERESHGQPRIECGIALHLGDLLYGNVGGRRRLDFTVIGPEVNLASRIESMTRELKRPVLVSARFAEAHGGAFENLGRFAFKGVAERKTVLAPER